MAVGIESCLYPVVLLRAPKSDGQTRNKSPWHQLKLRNKTPRSDEGMSTHVNTKTLGWAMMIVVAKDK